MNKKGFQRNENAKFNQLMVISKFHGNQYHRLKMIIKSKLEIYESTMRKPLTLIRIRIREENHNTNKYNR